ncbi:MAG: flavodoxin [Firmicutes bacterium]|nr:flavodoxin [Bacillota bacterium]
MKKLFASVFMILGLLCLTACASSTNESAPAAENTVRSEAAADTETDKAKPAPDNSGTETETPEQKESKDTVVVYFSATGTTKGVAEKIAAAEDADIYELIPAEPYSAADLDWNDKNSRTTLEMNDPDVRPAIGNDNIELDGYSTMYIGYPIWWGDAPRIMSTFVEAHDFDGITVIPFCTSGGSGIGKSGDNLASQAGSGNWLKGDRLNANVSEDEIQKWIDGLR